MVKLCKDYPVRDRAKMRLKRNSRCCTVAVSNSNSWHLVRNNLARDQFHIILDILHQILIAKPHRSEPRSVRSKCSHKNMVHIREPRTYTSVNTRSNKEREGCLNSARDGRVNTIKHFQFLHAA